MLLENVTVIFGPILANCGDSTDEAWLKREYNILHDMLTYYRWLFNVSDKEVNFFLLLNSLFVEDIADIL